MKNRILLENYYLPGALEADIEAFVEHYNHRRYHESLRVRPGTFLFFAKFSDHEAYGSQPQETQC